MNAISFYHSIAERFAYICKGLVGIKTKSRKAGVAASKDDGVDKL